MKGRIIVLFLLLVPIIVSARPMILLEDNAFNITASNVSAEDVFNGTFGASVGNGLYTFPDNLSVQDHIHVQGILENSTFDGDVTIKGTLYGASPLKVAGGMNVSGNSLFNNIFVDNCVGCPIGFGKKGIRPWLFNDTFNMSFNETHLNLSILNVVGAHTTTLPADNITNGTFGAGNYRFPDLIKAANLNASTINVTFLGLDAGASNSGSLVTGVGWEALKNNDGGSSVSLGNRAGFNNKQGRLSAIGFQAGLANAGDAVTVMGHRSGETNDGDGLVAYGFRSGFANSGDNVIAIGYFAGFNNDKDNQFILRHNLANSDPLISGNFSTGEVFILGNLSANLIFGEMYIFDNNASTPVTQNIYSNVTQNMSAGLLNGVVFQNGRLNIMVDGFYNIEFSASFFGQANNEYHTVIGINAFRSTKCHNARKIGTAGDIGDTGGNCILDLTTGDRLTLMIENTDSGSNPTVRYANVKIVRIGW